MALDFPNSPTNGQVYTDAGTGEQWAYDAPTNSWTSKGLINTSGGLQFKGSLDITAAPPTGLSPGWQYSVAATGTANAGFTGLTGTLTKGDVLLYTGPSGWTVQSHSVPDATAVVKGIDTQKWSRTGTTLSPATAGDVVTMSLGTAALPGLTPVGDPNTGIHSPGADQVAISTNGISRLVVDASGNVNTERMRITSAGQVTINNADAYGNLAIKSSSTFNTSDAPGSTTLYLSSQGTARENNYGASIGFTKINSMLRPGAAIGVVQTSADEDQCGLAFFTHSVATTGNAMYEAMRLGHAGTLTIHAAGSTPPIVFNQGPSEVARIDSSGRLLVGTSNGRGVSSTNQASLQIEDGGIAASFIRNTLDQQASVLSLGKSRGTSPGSYTSVIAETGIGQIRFCGADGTAFIQGARIDAVVDGTPSATSMPGRLVLSTTPAGGVAPVTRMTVKASGVINIANATVYADDTAAKAGGLVAGDIYRKATGELMITF